MLLHEQAFQLIGEGVVFLVFLIVVNTHCRAFARNNTSQKKQAGIAFSYNLYRKCILFSIEEFCKSFRS